MTAPAYTEPASVDDSGHPESPEPQGHDDHGHTDHNATYVKTALFLAVITGLETATYFFKDFPLWHWGSGVGLTLFLLTCMVIKFFTIVYVFMHLRYDNKLLSICFYAGLILAVTVYVAVLTAFRFWWSGSHMVQP